MVKDIDYFMLPTFARVSRTDHEWVNIRSRVRGKAFQVVWDHPMKLFLLGKLTWDSFESRHQSQFNIIDQFKIKRLNQVETWEP